MDVREDAAGATQPVMTMPMPLVPAVDASYRNGYNDGYAAGCQAGYQNGYEAGIANCIMPLNGNGSSTGCGCSS